MYLCKDRNGYSIWTKQPRLMDYVWDYEGPEDEDMSCWEMDSGMIEAFGLHLSMNTCVKIELNMPEEWNK